MGLSLANKEKEKKKEQISRFAYLIVESKFVLDQTFKILQTVLLLLLLNNLNPYEEQVVVLYRHCQKNPAR